MELKVEPRQADTLLCAPDYRTSSLCRLSEEWKKDVRRVWEQRLSSWGIRIPGLRTRNAPGKATDEQSCTRGPRGKGHILGRRREGGISSVDRWKRKEGWNPRPPTTSLAWCYTFPTCKCDNYVSQLSSEARPMRLSSSSRRGNKPREPATKLLNWDVVKWSFEGGSLLKRVHALKQIKRSCPEGGQLEVKGCHSSPTRIGRLVEESLGIREASYILRHWQVPTSRHRHSYTSVKNNWKT